MSPEPPESPERPRRTRTLVLVVLGVVFLLTLVVPAVLGRELATEVSAWVRRLVWLAVLVDYVRELRRAEDRWGWVLTHPLDLLVLLVPTLRPVLLLTALALRRRRRGSGRRAPWTTGAVERTAAYLASVTATLLLLFALAVYLAEQSVDDSPVATVGDALWFAVATVATVGYGDVVPVTPLGRAVSVGGMLLGIGVLGALTATVAAQVLRRVGADRPPDPVVEEVLSEVRALRAEVAALRAGAAPPSRPDAGDRAGGADPAPPPPPG